MNNEAVIRWAAADSAVNEGDVQRPKRLAVVGLSDKPDRPSNHVAVEMQRMGYQIVPVTPKGDVILGEKVYRSLAEIPFPVDVVDIFRAPEHIPAVLEDVKQMVHKPRVFWLQEGIVNDEAVAAATAYGLETVQDRCIYKEALRLRR